MSQPIQVLRFDHFSKTPELIALEVEHSLNVIRNIICGDLKIKERVI